MRLIFKLNFEFTKNNQVLGEAQGNLQVTPLRRQKITAILYRRAALTRKFIFLSKKGVVQRYPPSFSVTNWSVLKPVLMIIL